jgi:Fe-S-cluster containining protein
MEQFFRKLELLYYKMDKAFNKTAEHYGFKCNGCKDNCCKSFFYHHTFIEKDYLVNKAKEFDHDKKITLKKSAVLYLDTIENKPLCPLNRDELCILYNARPMICRLHGIPHHLNLPGIEIKQNPGCDAGASCFKSASYFSFDRIPFYREMVEIEKEYRQKFDLNGKTKQTIAHMLLDL